MDLKEKLVKAIEEAKSKAKKRNFLQSVDLTINFKGVDFSKPDKRINITVSLPKGRGKPLKAAVIAGDELITKAKKTDARVISKEELEKLSGNKKEIKKIANEYDVFFSQPDLMPLVGKIMGQALGPRGKMPKPVPPNADLELLIKNASKMINLRTKGKFLPTLHACIGTEDMSNEDLAENAVAVINALIEKLPNREGNLKSIYVKTTMGPSVKVELK